MRLDGLLNGIVVHFEDTASRRYLPEYETEYLEAVGDNPATVICYLECEEDKEFKIEVTKRRQWKGGDMKMYCYIDGRRISKRHWPSFHPKKTFDRLTERRNGDIVHANLKFSKLKLTHRHEEACHDPEILSSLGDIQIDFATGQGYHCNCASRPGGSRPVRVIGPIHEEAKKGKIGSTVSGGAAQIARTPRGRGGGRAHYHIPDSESVYRVIFKYRTRQLLMAQRIVGIAPTPQKPMPDRKRKREDDADEQDIEVIEDMVFEAGPLNRRVVSFDEDIKPIFFENVRRQGEGSILQPIDLTLD